MIKKILHKLFKTRDKRVENFAGRPYLLLCKKDIEKLLNGGIVSFEVEKFIPEILVCTEEHYDKLISEVKEYEYD